MCDDTVSDVVIVLCCYLRVATLEGLAALSVGCTDSMDMKLNFVFKCFDFKRDGDMSYDEVVIMLSSTLAAMAKMEKSGILPGLYRVHSSTHCCDVS